MWYNLCYESFLKSFNRFSDNFFHCKKQCCWSFGSSLFYFVHFRRWLQKCLPSAQKMFFLMVLGHLNLVLYWPHARQESSTFLKSSAANKDNMITKNKTICFPQKCQCDKTRLMPGPAQRESVCIIKLFFSGDPILNSSSTKRASMIK